MTTPQADPPLHGLRRRIDDVDEALLELLARRMALVHEIGGAKQTGDPRPVLDPAREREVARRWAATAEKHGLSGAFADRLLQELLNHSRQAQEALHPRARRGFRAWMACVGYQGVPGAYSELALAELMGRDAGYEAPGYPDFTELFNALERGDVDGVLVPIENSICGSIPGVVSLVVERDVVILDEVLWQVGHCLAALPGTRLEDVQRVLSHPAALEQCRGRLSARGMILQPWTDTAAAAAHVASAGDGTLAAVCSAAAAAAHGLQVLSRSVADNEHNRTRFLLVARGDDLRVAEHAVHGGGVPMKTSIVFTLRHQSGALARCLALLAEQGVNLTRIESRLRPSRRNEYAFLVDFEGERAEGNVRVALDQLARESGMLRVLGSYPDRMRETD